MLIRPYEVRDEQGVITLWSKALPSSAPHNDPATTIRQKLMVEDDLFVVAEVDDQIAGTAMGGYDGHRGWIYSVAVQSSHRRKHIGSALLRRLEEALSAMGCLKVNLQVRGANVEAIGFYRKLGYAVEERVSMGKCLYSSKP